MVIGTLHRYRSRPSKGGCSLTKTRPLLWIILCTLSEGFQLAHCCNQSLIYEKMAVSDWDAVTVAGIVLIVLDIGTSPSNCVGRRKFPY